MDLNLWKKVKKEKKLTIEDIARLSNLPKGSVQNIFAGYVPNPRIDTVEAIEKALGLDQRADIYSISGTSPITTRENEPMQQNIQNALTENELIVLNCFRELSEASQITVVNLLQNMAKSERASRKLG